MRERRLVGHDAREPDLLIAVVRAEAERVVDRAIHDLARDPPAPVRLLAEKPVHQLPVQSLLVGADPQSPGRPSPPPRSPRPPVAAPSLRCCSSCAERVASLKAARTRSCSSSTSSGSTASG